MKKEGLDSIISEFNDEGINLLRMRHDDMAKIMLYCNEKNIILWINDHSTLKPVFINDFGKEYYGFDRNVLSNEGFEFYNKFMHPDHFNDVHRTITFFEQHPTGTFKMPYIVKNSKGDWRWTYSEAKALNFTAEGKPAYILAVVYDIEGLLDNNGADSNGNFIKTNIDRYKSLTVREREVMGLIAREMTSHDIAGILHIEASTVDTHRKRIIKKLNVKNSIGLAKYSILFSENDI